MSDDLYSSILYGSASVISGSALNALTRGQASPTGGLSSGACSNSVDARKFDARCMPMGLDPKNLADCCAKVGGEAGCGASGQNTCYLKADKIGNWKKCFTGDYACVSAAPRRGAKLVSVLFAVALAVGLT